jgi:hypothetical protein
VVCADGSLKANFRDNTVLLLDPTGEAMTVHTPAGDTVRSLSQFAVSRFTEKLGIAMDFRNVHVDVPFCPPAVTRRFSRDAGAVAAASSGSGTSPHANGGGGGGGGGDAAATSTRVFRCEKRIAVTRWSSSVAEARQAGLFARLDGGGAALESMDGVARVVLSAHGLVTHVTYPLMYAAHRAAAGNDSTALSSGDAEEGAARDGDEGNASGATATSIVTSDDYADDHVSVAKAGSIGQSPSYSSRRRPTQLRLLKRPTLPAVAFEYVWHTQTFYAEACPERWAFPVALLQEVVFREAGGHAAAEAKVGTRCEGTESGADSQTQVDKCDEYDDDGDGDGDGNGDGAGASVPEATTPGTRRMEEAATAGSDEAFATTNGRGCRTSTTLPVSSTALSPTSSRTPLWVDDSPSADPQSWWHSASLLGYSDGRGGGGVVGGVHTGVHVGAHCGGVHYGQTLSANDRAVTANRRWSPPAVEHVPGMVQWTVRTGQSMRSVRGRGRGWGEARGAGGSNPAPCTLHPEP